MVRYHFTITIKGTISKAYVDAKNPMSAYNRAKRMFQQADKIHLVRSEKIKDY